MEHSIQDMLLRTYQRRGTKQEELSPLIANNFKTLTIKHTPAIRLLSRELASYVTNYEGRLLEFYSMESAKWHSSLLDQVESYERHPEITEALRARLIDWILHCTQVCEMTERNIYFIVIKLVDAFYRSQSQP